MSQQQDDQQNQALQQQQPQQQQQQQQNQQLMQQQIKLSQPDQQQDVVQQQQQQVQQQQQQVQQQNQQQQQQQNQLMQAGQIQQVQVIQNQQAAYLQQLYSGQGGLIMPAGNMQIGPMKVITQGQPGTYPTYPGTNNQTLVIGQLFSPQQGLIPTQSNQAKPQDMKPPTQGCVVSSQPQQLTSSQPQQLSHLISPIHFTNNGRTTVQSNQMQFTPWQFNTLPQGLAWASQPPILTQNSIFIGRGTQQDGSTQNPQANPAPMFVQQSPPPQHLQSHTQVAMQQSTTLPQLTSTPTAIKTRPDHIQPKTMNTICRPLMPNSVRGAPPINTAQGSTPVPKKRTKQVILRAPLVIPTQKMNNTNNKMIMTSTPQLMQHQQHQQQQTQTHTQLSAVASQQQIHASLSQHMGPTTQLTYTMAPPPPQGQFQQPQQQHMQPKPLIGMPMQSQQQIVAPQIQQQQQQHQPQPQQPTQPQPTPLPQAEPLPHPSIMQQPPQQQQQQQVPTQHQSHSVAVSLPPSSITHTMTPPTPLPPPPPPPVSTNHGTLEPSHTVSEQTAPVPPPPPSSSSQPQQHSMPSLSEDVESNNTASSVSSNTNTKDKPITTQATLPKTTALVKPQILTHVIEGFVIQESDQPFPVNRGACFDLIREDIGTDDGAPLAKKLHLEENVEDKKPLVGESTGCPQTPSLPNPLKWTVTEVCDFIRNLPGCAEYVEDFAMQEIDGQALMLLQAKHLMEAMSMKLGPALKIVAKIDSMRQAAEGAAGAPPPASTA